MELLVTGTTVQNSIKSDNTQDLILYGDAYLPSKNVGVGIESPKTSDNVLDYVAIAILGVSVLLGVKICTKKK